MNEDNKLKPGDKGFPGGTTTSTVYVNGKAKNMKVKKDAYGNVTYVSITDKLFGIF